MSDIISKLWEEHQSHIQIQSQQAFLEVNLKGQSEFADFDGSLWQDLIHSWMEAHATGHFFLLLNRQREESWKDPALKTNYQELVCFQANQSFMKGCVWKEHAYSSTEIQQMLQTQSEPLIETIATQQQAAVLFSNQPLALETICIPKPWGFEEWYTGVEQRGVAQIITKEGQTELPYALSLFRQPYLQKHSADLILLKTLNPVAEAVLGDLYLEMHEKKWEVYIVTEIDPEAWPSGEGIIKAGLHPQKVEEYQERYGKHWLPPYLNDFQDQVTAYETIRRCIDQQIDAMRHAQGIALDAPLSPQQTQKFLAQIPLEQQHKEKALRDQLYCFVGDLKVVIGDIIAFPTHQMHALQHGVRVIEFQTPHYERLIVMFGQKVLTQDHWDTAKALALMEPQIYHPPPLKTLEKTEGWKIERFVEFPDFSADRITLEAHSEYSDHTRKEYHLLIGVAGEGQLHASGSPPFLMQPKKGWFLPLSLEAYTLKNASNSPLIYLKATPKQKP